jgi:hypothetical protein
MNSRLYINYKTTMFIQFNLVRARALIITINARAFIEKRLRIHYY